MRIAFLADASLPHTLRWVNALVALGHDCLLLSAERGTDYHCRVERLPQRGDRPGFVHYTRLVPQVRQLLRGFAPDVVNAHFLPNYGWVAVRAGARPLVLTTLGSDILIVPKRSPLHRWRTTYVLSRCDAVTSDARMLSAAIARFGVPEERIVTVPFGIEAARFTAPQSRPAKPIVVLSTRRLDPIYDVGTLLHAYDRLTDSERQALDMRVAGHGTEGFALRARAAQSIRFLGWLQAGSLDAQLGAAHIYVSTSLSDSTSVSLLEAMAAGCFPVVTDIPANREWVEDGTTALLFPAGDDAALATCLRRAASDAALRARAAVTNRATVVARATWEKNINEVEALFLRLASRATNHPGAPPRLG